MNNLRFSHKFSFILILCCSIFTTAAADKLPESVDSENAVDLQKLILQVEEILSLSQLGQNNQSVNNLTNIPQLNHSAKLQHIQAIAAHTRWSIETIHQKEKEIASQNTPDPQKLYDNLEFILNRLKSNLPKNLKLDINQASVLESSQAIQDMYQKLLLAQSNIFSSNKTTLHERIHQVLSASHFLLKKISQALKVDLPVTTDRQIAAVTPSASLSNLEAHINLQRIYRLQHSLNQSPAIPPYFPSGISELEDLNQTTSLIYRELFATAIQLGLKNLFELEPAYQPPTIQQTWDNLRLLGMKLEHLVASDFGA